MSKETAAARDMRKSATAKAEEIGRNGPPITDFNMAQDFREEATTTEKSQEGVPPTKQAHKSGH